MHEPTGRDRVRAHSEPAVALQPLHTAALTLPPHQGSCEGKPAPAERKPSQFGRGCLGAACATRGSRSLTQQFCQSRHLDGVQPPLFPREYKKTSAEVSNTTLLSAACSEPACKPPVRGQDCSKPERKGPIPSSHLPHHTSRHSSTHGTHTKILHISHSPCPDTTATGASLLLTPAHPAEPSFPVRYSSSPLPTQHSQRHWAKT